MIVTIIGSLQTYGIMMKVQKIFLDKGFSVYSPCNSELQKKPLIAIQSEYLEKIKAADLIIAVPKATYYGDQPGDQNNILYFGESTSYELAVAKKLNKPIVYWAW